MDRTAAVPLLLAVAILASGSVGAGAGPAYPDPPASLDDESVERVVLEYEQLRVEEAYDDPAYDYFHVGYMSHLNEADVRNRSDDGVYVEVQVVYSYTEDELHADGVPVRSLYVVNESAIERVRGL